MDLDNVYVADCETDGFIDEATKVHVFGIGWKYNGQWQIKETPAYSNMVKVLSNPDNVVIFHNGYLFDSVILSKLLNIKVKAEIIDTLAISWVLFPNRIKEGKKWGLGSFAPDYGFKKPDIESWTDLSYEEYANRVREDVRINIALWEDCLAYYRELYDNDDIKIISHIRFLSEGLKTIAQQEQYGIKLDREKCEENIKILDDLSQKKIDILKSIMPKIPVEVIRKKPKNLYKKDLSLSEAGLKWKCLTEGCELPLEYEGDIKEVLKYEDANPLSVQQVKKYLFEIGWSPEIYVDSISTKGEVKQVEQIKDKDKNLCKSVLALIEKAPELEALADLSTILHRKAYLVGFLKNVKPNGYIQAQIAGLTNTIRFRHKTLVNLIKVSAPFGEYVRPVLTCEEDEVFVGSDINSLENYTRTNFIADIDPKAIDILSDPDYDTHTQLGIYAGLMTEDEESFFKWYKKGTKNRETLPEIFKVYNDEELSEQFIRINAIRNKSKTTSYSALYGIGNKKLAKELKISEKEAQQLLDGYWKLNDAVKVFSNSCETKTVRGQLWVLNPGNGYWYTLRKEFDIFSTVNQGFGSYLHILWCRNVRSLGVKIVGNFHDEILTVCKSEDYEDTKAKLQLAMEMTNRQTKLRVPLKIEVQKGENYGEVH